MAARFRIRTSSGQEISFATLEIFSEFVRSGDLSPTDVVYDAETREWSSGLTHPVVLELQLEAEEAKAASAAAASAPPKESEQGGTLDMQGIGLELAPAETQLTPEQEAETFVAKMKAERQADLGPGQLPLEDSTPAQGRVSLEREAIELAPAPRPVGPAPRPRRVKPPPVPQEPEAPAHAPTYAPELRYEPPPQDEAPGRTPARRSGAGSGAGRRYAPFIIIMLVLGAAGVYFGPGLLTSTPRSGGVPGAEGGPTGAASEPGPTATEDEIRREAEERFLATTQSALRDLDPIPDIWLRGAYLAAPSEYPNVRAVWDEYLTTVRDVRAGDAERYEAAYARALDDARVEGSERSDRWERALDDFRGSAARRSRHYDAVEALAVVALAGHDALVRAEGTIAYQPASGRGLSGDPVIEAVGRGPEAQALLNEILDEILAHMHGDGGPGEAANVREWVWAGLLDAVANP